jgi:hypothetical protein
MHLYRYETHLHTKEASACANTSGAQHAREYKELGYAGIIVTDHFFNGNSCVARNLPWEQWVDLFCKGYENAKKEGDRIGLSVFLGWESCYRGTEFLIYGLDKQWLKAHPQIIKWSIKEQYQRVHEAGGFVVQAHPFREASYIMDLQLLPDCVDAVEAINARNTRNEYNDKAVAYAHKYNLPTTSGTDAHGMEKNHVGVAFEQPLGDIKDYIGNIKAGGYELLGKDKYLTNE